DETGLKFELAPVESPLAGVVGKILLDKGATVAPFVNVFQQVALASIVNMDEMIVKFDIPESAVPYVKNGLKAQIRVDAYPNDNFVGEVTRVSEVVDMQTRTLPIEITISNKEHKLKSGMFAKVSLILRSKLNTPVILKEAILGKEPDNYVYVIQNNKAVLKDISVGMRQGPYYEVRQGLKAGDLVVIMGQQRLFEGADVRIEE
ncbi:MAG: efflux RND transporter periplasmic adaptor subunit, partial [Candidatus Omnitrophica bacterium]|nr:efflux RND transporter periplasmic adaptor subunit [Candidatus Omnitrophota bacterium]